MKLRTLLFAALMSATATAQTTWIVNAGGGPGVNFTDLPTAVAAAASGDTIIVQMGPSGQGADGFTTNKGLTIIGESGSVPLTDNGWTPFIIQNLPPSASFRMVGFSRPSNGELNFQITNCLGEVHLERLEAREPQMFFPTTASIKITASDNVTLREVVTFGSPAVEANSSRLTLVTCQLGLTKIGLGGGIAVKGNNSTISIVEPRFDTGAGEAVSIETVNCVLTIAGDPASSIVNYGGDVINATGGQVLLDPAVTLTAGVGFQPVTGTAPVTSLFVPATWSTNVHPGQSMMATTWAPPGSTVFLAVGSPGAPVATGFGTLGIDVLQPFTFLPVFQSPAGGLTDTPLLVPASVVVGSAFSMQALVVEPTQVRLGLPVTVVAH